MDNSENAELNYCYNCMTRMDSGQMVCPVCGHDNSHRQNPENALPEGTILAGKFLVGKVLGQGGFGITYLGFDTALNVKVAIKEYFPVGVGVRLSHSIRVTSVSSQEKTEGFRKGCDEFQAEAQRLAANESPNIVKVRDYFQENGTAYIVMNYLEGNTLTKEVAACGGKMPWNRVVNLFTPLILELDKLHKAHLIHRDIKPDNIKVVKDNVGAEHLVLLDFGSARSFVSSEISQTYTAMITPGYAPYEQYMSHAQQGPYTDIYALCATMYAVITGILPATATERMIGEKDILPFRKTGVDIPENVEKAIFHGLAVRSKDRPQSMRELYEELNRKEPAVSDGRLATEKTAPQPLKVEKPAGNRIAAAEKPVPEPRKAEEKQVKTWKYAEEAKPKIYNWMPLLLAMLLVGGIFLYRGKLQNQMNTSATQNPIGRVQNVIQATQTKKTEPTSTRMPTKTNTPKPTATPIPNDTQKSIVKVGEIITLGHYEQDGNKNNGAEAVEWQVLAVEKDRALVISRYSLDAKPYNEEKSSVTWATSTLRTWLNGEFYNNAFSSAEKGAIQQVTVKNSDNTKYGTEGGNDTTDRIFLLSIDEAKMYFVNDEARKCEPTAYSKNKGSWVNDSSGMTWWWLRSPGINGNYDATVHTNGDINYLGYRVNINNMSVRPAFWLDLNAETIFMTPETLIPSNTSTPYAAPKPTNTPKPTETKNPVYRVILDTLLRDRPTNGGTVLRSILKGTVLTYSGESKEAEGKTWIHVRTENGNEGWINKAAAELQNNDSRSLREGDIITLGHYEQDGNKNNGLEAIEWQVLTVEDNRALVISRYGLDAKPYNEEKTSVTWETCTLRAWLNVEFYKSTFSNEEKEQIQTVSVKNPNNATYGTKGGNDTTDRIFLLSIDEAEQYFENDEARKCEPTAYSKNNGSWVNDSSGMTWWWLRSPGINGNYDATVHTNGNINYLGYRVNINNISVRPAFWLNL